MSLANALNILGIPTLHHRFARDIDGKRSILRLQDLASENMADGKRPFFGLDEDFQGFCDFSGKSFYQQIDLAYPNSKFIVTKRDLESWLESRFLRSFAS